MALATEPRVLASTEGMSREEWLRTRKRGIGSSDAAAIAGLNPYKSALAVYLEKLDELPAEPENEAMHFGNVLEPVVADEFALRTKFQVRRRNAILQHPVHDFALANLDREVMEAPGRWSLLECKTASEWLLDDWQDGRIPDAYAIQVHHQLWVTGRDHGWIAVLVGGNKFLHYRIDADPDLFTYLEQIESAFWQRVQDHNPPPADGSASSMSALAALYPMEEVAATLLPLEAGDLLTAYDRASADLKDAEERKAAAKNALCQMLGPAQVGYIGGQRVCSWKHQHRNGYTVWPTDFRKFDRIKPREAR